MSCGKRHHGPSAPATRLEDETSELLAELRDVLSDQEVKEFVTLLGELKDFDIFPCVLELLRALAHHIFAQDEYSP